MNIPIIFEYINDINVIVFAVFALADRLKNFQVGTSNDSPQTKAPAISNYNVCAKQATAVGAGETKALKCDATARYVIVQLNGYQYLTLCEVEVWGPKGRIPIALLQTNT